jgi:eukaryotic-like serine/threonine-protein kinase
MGTVHRGRDLVDGHTVAIKILDPTASGTDAERFAREAEILRSLDHPALVRYVDHGETDRHRFLVMEWLDGETLEARLSKTGLTAAEALVVARELAEALAVVHAHGLIHRDLKPSNVILLPAGGLKLIDFGIARQQHEANGLTRTGSMVGTPAYMSPEQALGKREMSPAADLFALGCVLYEALTGRPAFLGAQLLAIRAKILSVHPPPPRLFCPEAPAELDELVRRLLAKSPALRFADGREAAAALAQIPPVGEGPARPRRPRQQDRADLRRVAELDTQVSPVLMSVVLAAQPEEALGGAALSPEALAARSAALADVGGEPLQFPDGAVAVVFRDDPRGAAACARKLFHLLPDAAVAIASESPSALSAALDEAVHTMGGIALETLFGARKRTIELDERTAAELGVERDSEGRRTLGD